MAVNLPSSKELCDLPFRAIVAYASRAAERVMKRHHVAYDEKCIATLRIVNAFVSSPSLSRELAQNALLAAAAVAASEAADENRYIGVGLSVRAAAQCCAYAVRAAQKEEIEAAELLNCAAHVAVRAARQMDEVDHEFAFADFRRLLQIFGGDESTFGEPFDPSDDGPLGPISVET